MTDFRIWNTPIMNEIEDRKKLRKLAKKITKVPETVRRYT